MVYASGYDQQAPVFLIQEALVVFNTV